MYFTQTEEYSRIYGLQKFALCFGRIQSETQMFLFIHSSRFIGSEKPIQVFDRHQPHQRGQKHAVGGFFKEHRILSGKPGSIVAFYRDIILEAAKISTINNENIAGQGKHYGDRDELAT